MTEKDMVNDYLSMLNSSLTSYAGVISQCENPELRKAFQQLRNDDENRQFRTYQVASQKGFYQPAAQAPQNEIQQVKSQLQSSSPQQNQQAAPFNQRGPQNNPNMQNPQATQFNQRAAQNNPNMHRNQMQ